jgi:hypothetical protein
MSQPPDQISPDGLWRWDGQRWVPTGAAAYPAPAPKRGSLAWLWWLAGGCAVLLVIAIVAGILGLTTLFRNFTNGGYSCLPSDFPAYPGASVTFENDTVGTRNECRMTLTSNDDVGTVTDWYASHLAEGDWQDSVDSASGTITFNQVSGGHGTGHVQLLGAGQHTDIEITFDT